MSSGAATATGARAALRYALMGATSVGMALVAAVWLSSATLAADPLVVAVGDRDGTAAVQAYLPGAITIEADTTVTFRLGPDVPHSITIGDGPDGMAPARWPVAGWPEPETTAPGPDATAQPVDLGMVWYGDGGFINTGLLPGGATASVTFQAPGVYEVYCVGHPGMIAVVTVVEPGGAPVTTQDDADAAAAASREGLLGQADALRETRLANVESITASDGSTTWNVFADAATVPNQLPGGGTGYLELFESFPATLTIAPGDTVHWSAVGVHTVTFPADQDPTRLDPFGPATTDDTFDGTRPASSGPLNLETGSPSAFTLTFPTGGTYQYLCLFHADLGHVGVVQVGEPTTPEASPAASPAG